MTSVLLVVFCVVIAGFEIYQGFVQKRQDDTLTTRLATMNGRLTDMDVRLGGVTDQMAAAATTGDLADQATRSEHWLDELTGRISRLEGGAPPAESELAARLDRLEAGDLSGRVDRLEASDVSVRLERLETADLGVRLDRLEADTARHQADAPELALRLERIEAGLALRLDHLEAVTTDLGVRLERPAAEAPEDPAGLAERVEALEGRLGFDRFDRRVTALETGLERRVAALETERRAQQARALRLDRLQGMVDELRREYLAGLDAEVIAGRVTVRGRVGGDVAGDRATLVSAFERWLSAAGLRVRLQEAVTDEPWSTDYYLSADDVEDLAGSLLVEATGESPLSPVLDQLATVRGGLVRVGEFTAAATRDGVLCGLVPESAEEPAAALRDLPEPHRKLRPRVTPG